mmetsp:Transcript_26030/g.28955  ORF Transcript_26030/g.28955 Transcript_26030/m.28955 type:complete len:507 (-) Transcript_26030:154-1674(-)
MAEHKPLPYVDKSIRQSNVKQPAGALVPGWQAGPPFIASEEISYDQVEDYLGEGTFGKVYKGRCRGGVVAVKVPIKQKLSKHELEEFKKEVAIMSQIFHPNVVLFMGACTVADDIKIVTEMMDTDLEKLLHSDEGRDLPLLERMKMAKGAALGMSWLHGINKIIHRDLKPANLLVDRMHRVKVTDFGFSQSLREDMTCKDKFGPRGTALWMAPEVMNSEEFDQSIDVYSFGIVLWEIYTLREPFNNYKQWAKFFEAVCVDGERPPIDNKCKPSLRYLLEACWNADRKKRPTFQEVVFRLDEVMVDLAINDRPSRKFWKKHFLLPKQELQDTLSWKDFTKALIKSTKLDNKSRFDVLKDLLCDDSNKVSMTRFNRAVNWFGRFYKADTAKDMFAEIKEITCQDWFHGDIDKATAELRLNFRKSGSFLVRLSSTLPQYPFTISIAGSHAKSHKRVKKTVKSDGSFQFTVGVKKGVKTFPSIVTLVKQCEKDLKLKHCCPKDIVENPYT